MDDPIETAARSGDVQALDDQGEPALEASGVPDEVLETPAEGLDRIPQPPKRVIIIGGGIAGLVAGFELLRQGHEPLILEAQHRVGGRVYTLRDFALGLYAEAGAMRIPRVHDLTLEYCRLFGLELRPFVMGNPSAQFILKLPPHNPNMSEGMWDSRRTDLSRAVGHIVNAAVRVTLHLPGCLICTWVCFFLSALMFSVQGNEREEAPALILFSEALEWCRVRRVTPLSANALRYSFNHFMGVSWNRVATQWRQLKLLMPAVPFNLPSNISIQGGHLLLR